MASVNLPYVKPQRDRAGRLAYWYFRHNGRQWRLPGTPLSEEFMLEYQRLLALTHADTAPENGAIDKRGYAPGSFGTLVNDYLGSGNFKQLKPRTAAEYKRVLENLQRQHGHKPVSQNSAAPHPQDAR